MCEGEGEGSGGRGRGAGSGQLGGNCGTDVRASISKHTPFIYLKKNGPIHILDRPKCSTIHILPFDFHTHLLLVFRQISQSIHWLTRE